MGLEGPVVGHAHGLAQGPDESLVRDGHGVCEEEEAQGDVEEREGGDDCLCGYEGHFVVVAWSAVGLVCVCCSFCSAARSTVGSVSRNREADNQGSSAEF